MRTKYAGVKTLVYINVVPANPAGSRDQGSGAALPVCWTHKYCSSVLNLTLVVDQVTKQSGFILINTQPDGQVQRVPIGRPLPPPGPDK